MIIYNNNNKINEIKNEIDLFSTGLVWPVLSCLSLLAYFSFSSFSVAAAADADAAIDRFSFNNNNQKINSSERKIKKPLIIVLPHN